jgi:hypothetical protein
MPISRETLLASVSEERASSGAGWDNAVEGARNTHGLFRQYELVVAGQSKPVMGVLMNEDDLFARGEKGAGVNPGD